MFDNLIIQVIHKWYCQSFTLIIEWVSLVQVVIWIVIPKLRGSKSLNTKNLLKFIVFFQYVPRVFRIYPLYKEVTRSSGILTETAWAGAAFNLFVYMLCSHVSVIIWSTYSNCAADLLCLVMFSLHCFNGRQFMTAYAGYKSNTYHMKWPQPIFIFSLLISL